MWFRRKLKVSDVGGALARQALTVDDDEQGAIETAASDGGLDASRVRQEYQFLKIYILETALQNVEKFADEVVTAYRTAIEEADGCPHDGRGFSNAYGDRIAHYDTAWGDPRGIGWPQAMAGAFAERCTDGDPAEVFFDVMPLWIRVSSNLVAFGKWAKSVRLANG